MCAEKRLTAPAAPAPAPASKGGRWQTLTLSVAQWPIATRIVLLALLPLLALGMAGGPPQPVRLTVHGPAAATWASLQRIDQTLALAGAALVLLAVIGKSSKPPSASRMLA